MLRYDLKCLAYEKGYTMKTLIKEINTYKKMSRATFYRKLKNRTLTVEDMQILIKILHLNRAETTNVFFKENVS